MSEQFKEYVTGTSFALTLSRRMIDMLCQADHYGHIWGFGGTANSLVGRGLIEWMSPESEDQQQFRRYKLTDAGKAVIPLLRLAGLYIEQPKWEEPAPLPDIVITVKRKEP